MACKYQQQDPKETFRNSVKFMTKLIEVAEQEGYTRTEAIELLKIYALNGIDSNTGRM